MQEREEKREDLRETADLARAAFAAALKKHEQENNPDAAEAPAEDREKIEEAEEEPQIEGLEFISLEEDEGPSMAVPPQDPDTAGQAVLKTGRILHRIGRPVLYVGNLLFAPVIKPFKKGADQITKRDWALFFLMLAAVAAMIGTVNLSVWFRNRHRVEDRIYTVSMGYRQEFDGGKLEADKEGNTTFSSGDYSVLADGQPYYYENEDRMLLSTPYIWYPVEETYARAVERYSTLTLSSGAVTAKLPNGTETKITGFLYDNRDTYVFLEPVYVTCDEETVRIPALSFVRTYNGSVDIYPYGAEEGYFLTYEEELIASFDNGAGVQLAADTMYYSNGISRLIQDSVEQMIMLGE